MMLPMVTGIRLPKIEPKVSSGAGIGARQAGLYHKAKRQEEHICHAVFKAHGDEGRYGHQQRDEFAGHVERAEGEPDGEADEPVAEEAAQNHLGKRDAYLGGGD